MRLNDHVSTFSSGSYIWISTRDFIVSFMIYWVVDAVDMLVAIAIMILVITRRGMLIQIGFIIIFRYFWCTNRTINTSDYATITTGQCCIEIFSSSWRFFFMLLIHWIPQVTWWITITELIYDRRLDSVWWAGIRR